MRRKEPEFNVGDWVINPRRFTIHGPDHHFSTYFVDEFGGVDFAFTVPKYVREEVIDYLNGYLDD